VSQQRARAEANERRDERGETVAIAISLVLIVGALVALIGAVLLSRVPPSRHAPAQWIPRTPTLMFSRPANPADSPMSDDATRAGGPRLRTAGLSRFIAWFRFVRNAHQRGARGRSRQPGQARARRSRATLPDHSPRYSSMQSPT